MKPIIQKWIVLVTILIPSIALCAASPRGLVLYTEPPATYPESLEFVSLSETSVVFATAILANGTKQEIARNGILAVIPYPPEVPTDSLPQQADAALHSIQIMRSKYPQFAAKLDAAQTRWTNSQEFYRQRQRLPKATPPKAAPTITLEVDGVTYTQVVLTSFDGTSVGIEHSAGAARIPAIKLKPEQITALNASSSSVRIDPSKIAVKFETPTPSGMPATALPAAGGGRSTPEGVTKEEPFVNPVGMNNIQATAETINVTEEDLADYLATMEKMYGSVGISGPTVLAHSLDAAVQGKVIAQIGQSTGDISLSDTTAVMAMAGKNKTSLESSGAMRLATSIASNLQAISPAFRASIRMKNGTSLESAGGRLRMAMASGNPDDIHAAIGAFDGVQNNPYFNMSKVRQNANQLSPEDYTNADKYSPEMATVGGIRGREVLNSVLYNLSKDQSVMSALGSKSNISEFIDTLEGTGQMVDADALRKKLNEDPKYKNMTDAQKEAVAVNMSSAFKRELNNETRAQRRGFDDTSQLKVDVVLATSAAQKAAAKLRSDRSARAILLDQSDKSGSLFPN